MSTRVFISIPTERDESNAPIDQQLRTRIVAELSQPAVQCIFQEWLEADGSNPLVKIADTIRYNCDILFQVIYEQSGQIPPREHALELIRHLNRTGQSIRYRFPCLFDVWPSCSTEVWEHLTYTQWEAWLAKYYEKNVVVFQFERTDLSLATNDGLAGWANYLRIAEPFFQPHSSHRSFDKLSIAMHRVLLNLVSRQKRELSSVKWEHPAKVPFSFLANRFDEINLLITSFHRTLIGEFYYFLAKVISEKQRC